MPSLFFIVWIAFLVGCIWLIVRRISKTVSDADNKPNQQKNEKKYTPSKGMSPLKQRILEAIIGEYYKNGKTGGMDAIIKHNADEVLENNTNNITKENKQLVAEFEKLKNTFGKMVSVDTVFFEDKSSAGHNTFLLEYPVLQASKYMVPTIKAKGNIVQFFDAFVIFIYADMKVALFSYSEIALYADIITETFDRYLGDSTLLSIRYLHQRVDGGPDRRYKYNPCSCTQKISRLRLGNFIFRISKVTGAGELHKAILNLASSRPKGMQPFDSLADAFGILRSVEIDEHNRNLENFLMHYIRTRNGLMLEHEINGHVCGIYDIDASKRLLATLRRMAAFGVISRLAANPVWNADNRRFIRIFATATGFDYYECLDMGRMLLHAVIDTNKEKECRRELFRRNKKLAETATILKQAR